MRFLHCVKKQKNTLMLLKKGGNLGSDEEKADFSLTVRFALRRIRALACGNRER